MTHNRKGEEGPPPPRSSRIFNMKDSWYFSTREGADIGPFNSRDEADSGLVSFLQFIHLANKKTLNDFFNSLNAQNDDHATI